MKQCPLRSEQADVLKAIFDESRRHVLTLGDDWKDKVADLLDGNGQQYIASDRDVNLIMTQLEVMTLEDFAYSVPLTIEGGIKLAGTNRRLDRLAAQMAGACIKILHTYARQYSQDEIELDDLVQDGFIEACRAVRTFKYVLDVNITTYVIPRLKVLFARRTRHYRTAIEKSQRTIDEERLYNRLRDEGMSDADIQAKTGWTESYFAAVRRHAPIVMVEEAAFEKIGDDNKLEDDIERDDVYCKVKTTLKHKLMSLTDRERICLMHAARLVSKPLTIEELANNFGVSKARVSQYRNSAVKRLGFSKTLAL
ncbi:sigma-70 family RNA polymerase sigma factor [uncultured Photobacterium sp.]|uniref:sigma-70 family RNA polymerase sigma factor n=1 Tax=uncultured Photobacterium sp. TaxID=173973 RepID=UPI0026396BB1|nr:sigma-70 family RNA polymerase sigma factor [uncultured Photobacterium sp.]